MSDLQSSPKPEPLDGRAFEDLVQSLLEKMGLSVEGRRRGADGGIDMVARSPDPILGGTFIIQCKRYAWPVPVHHVRDLYGVVTAEAANKGILITDSRFTREAIVFAEGKPVELIDGSRLDVLLQKYGLSHVTGSSSGVVVSPAVRPVQIGLCRIVEDAASELDQISAGRVFLPRRSRNLGQYTSMIISHSEDLKAGIKTLTAVIEEFSRLTMSMDLSSGDAALLNRHLKEIERLVARFVEIHRESVACDPPKALADLHDTYYLHVVPEFVSSLRAAVAELEQLLGGETAGGTYDIKINVAGKSMLAFFDLLSERINRSQSTGPSDG